MGRSSLMYLQSPQRKTQRRNSGKRRIWKEERRDEGAAYWGEGVHSEWLMRLGFWVNLPSNKNGLIHPFLSPGPQSHAHPAERLSGTFSSMAAFKEAKSSHGISALLASLRLQPLYFLLFLSPLSTFVSYLSLWWWVYSLIFKDTRYTVPFPQLTTHSHQRPLPCRLSLIHGASWLPFSPPFPTQLSRVFFLPLTKHRVTPVGGECSYRQ